MRHVDQAFVVNLERRRDRLEMFHRHVPPSLGVPLQTVAAVDGGRLSEDLEDLRLFEGNNFGFRANVVGCALSHYYLWQRIAAGPHERVAVFEDDAWFSSRFLSLWNEEMAPRIPADFDLIYLGGLIGPSTWNELHTLSKRLRGHIALPAERYSESAVNASFAIPRPMQICTYAYLLSRCGARKLCGLVEREGIKVAIDWFLVYHWTALRVYVTTPLLCWSVSLEGSDILNSTQRLRSSASG